MPGGEDGNIVPEALERDGSVNNETLGSSCMGVSRFYDSYWPPCRGQPLEQLELELERASQDIPIPRSGCTKPIRSCFFSSDFVGAITAFF